MTELVLKTSRWAIRWTEGNLIAHPVRLLVLALLGLFIYSPELRPVILGAIQDAYLAVTVFVAATLAVFYALERGLGIDLGEKMAKAGLFQAPIAAFLGALPGCGGAIIVVTQYTKGLISFGSVVAVLIATMGDAAFLLLARDPLTGAGVLATGFIVGTLSGWAIDAFHGKNFMRAKPQQKRRQPIRQGQQSYKATRSGAGQLSSIETIWVAILLPSIIIGLALAFLVEVDDYFGALSAYQPTLWIGAAGGILCLLMWSFSSASKAHVGQETEDIYNGTNFWHRVIRDTNFVTTWVVFGFLAYELAIHFSGSGIESWFKTWAPVVPLVAVLVGFIPGCGPQIIVTTLYLNGIIPLAALYGNAIANDGDALFPALALAPKAAIYATLYSAVPALIISYLIFFTT